jgi:hypothetical protein
MAEWQVFTGHSLLVLYYRFLLQVCGACQISHESLLYVITAMITYLPHSIYKHECCITFIIEVVHKIH